MTEKTNIFFSANSFVSEQVNVMLKSLFKYSPGDLHIYVLVRNQRELNFYSILLKNHHRHNVIYEIIICKLNRLKNIDLWAYPIEILFRLQIINIFRNKNIKKLIYVDTDIIFQENVINLFKIPIKTVIGGVEDFYSGRYLTKNIFLRHGIALNSYINSWMLLINFELLSQKFTQSKIDAFILKYRIGLKCFDQDLINIIFSSEITLIDSRWNQIPYFWHSSISNNGIIHYAWEMKCGSFLFAYPNIHKIYYCYKEQIIPFLLNSAILHRLIVKPICNFIYIKNKIKYAFFQVSKLDYILFFLFLLYPPCSMYFLLVLAKIFVKKTYSFVNLSNHV